MSGKEPPHGDALAQPYGRTAGSPPVAFLGMGRMGAAMAARLVAAGAPTTLWNRTPSTALDVGTRIGARVAASPREAVARVGVVFVSVKDDGAARATYGGREGLLEGLRPGAVVVEMSTLDPQTVRALAAEVAARSATLVDAPVSGSVPQAKTGELSVLVGGPAEAVERVRPLLEILGSTLVLMGDVGAGATAKLAVNVVLLGLNQAVAEALALVQAAGLSAEKAYDVLTSGTVAAPYVARKRDAFLRPDSAEPAFVLDLVAKDLRLAAALADRLGVAADQTRVDLATAEAAVAAGWGARDASAIGDWLHRGMRGGAGG